MNTLATEESLLITLCLQKFPSELIEIIVRFLLVKYLQFPAKVNHTAGYIAWRDLTYSCADRIKTFNFSVMNIFITTFLDNSKEKSSRNM